MIIDNQCGLLTAYQDDLLRKYAETPYSFGFRDDGTRYSSIDNLLTSLGVKVVIEKKEKVTVWCDFLDRAEKYWSDEVQRLKREKAPGWELEKAEGRLRRIQSEKNVAPSRLIFDCYPLGCYSRSTKTIKLFWERMKEIEKGFWMNNYLISTFIHEAMHAYFDRPGCNHHPYAMFVEEPLAEFGMLLYLETVGADMKAWARNEVEGKEGTCYGYGMKLYWQYAEMGYEGILGFLEAYKLPVGEYEMLDIGRNGGFVSFPWEMDSNGLMLVRGADGHLGMADRYGKIIVPASYEAIKPDRSRYIARGDGIEVVYNAQGKIVL